MVPKSTSIKNVKTLPPNQTSHFVFTFAGTSSASSQNYPVEFTIEYETSGKDVTTFKQYAGVNISNPEKDKEETKKTKRKVNQKLL